MTRRPAGLSGPVEVAAAAPTLEMPIERMYRVPDVSQRLGMSEDWTRRYFSEVPGVKTITSPTRRGRRSYNILLIPESVLLRELRNFEG